MPEPHAPATKYRWHRGSLAASMETVVECTSHHQLCSILASEIPLNRSDVAVVEYGFDTRNGWNKYIVSIKDVAVGFTNGPLEPEGEQPMAPNGSTPSAGEIAMTGAHDNRRKIEDLGKRLDAAELSLARTGHGDDQDVKAAIDAHRTNRAKIDDMAKRQEKAEGRMAGIERELIDIREANSKLRDKVETLSSFA